MLFWRTACILTSVNFCVVISSRSLFMSGFSKFRNVPPWIVRRSCIFFTSPFRSFLPPGSSFKKWRSRRMKLSPACQEWIRLKNQGRWLKFWNSFVSCHQMLSALFLIIYVMSERKKVSQITISLGRLLFMICQVNNTGLFYSVSIVCSVVQPQAD